jgi:hypothetical protein
LCKVSLGIQLALLLEQRYQWAAVLAFTELQTDCDAPVSEFLWVSNGFDQVLRLPQPMALKRFECLI